MSIEKPGIKEVKEPRATVPLIAQYGIFDEVLYALGNRLANPGISLPDPELYRVYLDMWDRRMK